MPTLTTRTQSRRKRLWPWLLTYALLLGAAAVFAYMAAANFSAAVVKLGAPGPRLGAVQALWLRIALAPAADQLFAASSPDTAGISLIVESGELPAAVAKRIAALGLAPDAQLLLLFMIYKGYDKQMQAGYFKLSHSMPPAEIAAALVNAMPSEVRVRIWAGWRAGQVVASLAAQPHLQIDPSALLRMIDGRDSNYNFVNAQLIDTLKPNATFINTSRGRVVDHHALARFLHANSAAQALLDVHDPEPFLADSPMLHLANAHLAPHLASRTDTAVRNMSWVVRDLVAVLNNSAPQFEA